jgi:hypothetical protein
MFCQISSTSRKIAVAVVATAKQSTVSIEECNEILEDCYAMLSAPDTAFPRSGRFVADEFRNTPGFVEALVRLLTRVAAQPSLCALALDVVCMFLDKTQGTDPWSAEADACKRHLGAAGLPEALASIFKRIATASPDRVFQLETARLAALAPPPLAGRADVWRSVLSYHLCGAALVEGLARRAVRVLLRTTEHSPDHVQAFGMCMPPSAGGPRAGLGQGPCDFLLSVCRRHQDCPAIVHDTMQVSTVRLHRPRALLLRLKIGEWPPQPHTCCPSTAAAVDDGAPPAHQARGAHACRGGAGGGDAAATAPAR